MVTMNHQSVEDPEEPEDPEDPEDASLLLAEAGDTVAPTPVCPRRQQTRRNAEPGDFFLSRRANLACSLLLLLTSYSAILIPAYFPLDQAGSPSDDYQEPKDLLLLNRSASLLSAPCRPGWCVDHLKPLACSAGLLHIPVFVQPDGLVPSDRSPPLGFRGSEQNLAQALASLPQPGLPPTLGGAGRCRRCVVVGSGGVLHGSHLGPHIDRYDIIIRMNNAPVRGFERDAGSRTTIRLMYPEGAPRSFVEYQRTSMVALVVFKGLDLDWLTSVISKQPLSFWSKLWFWREVVEDVPLGAERFRILNPEVVRKTGQALQNYAVKKGEMVPTLGASAVVMALQLCDQVSLAGFGYDLQHPDTRLHYYESLRMGAIKAQVVHDVSAEKLFLKDLVSAGAITDLTGAL